MPRRQLQTPKAIITNHGTINIKRPPVQPRNSSVGPSLADLVTSSSITNSSQALLPFPASKLERAANRYLTAGDVLTASAAKSHRVSCAVVGIYTCFIVPGDANPSAELVERPRGPKYPNSTVPSGTLSVRSQGRGDRSMDSRLVAYYCSSTTADFFLVVALCSLRA